MAPTVNNSAMMLAIYFRDGNSVEQSGHADRLVFKVLLEDVLEPDN